MRFLFKVLALVIFGPLVLGLLLVLAIVAMVGLPLLWEELTARFTAPPSNQGGATPPAV